MELRVCDNLPSETVRAFSSLSSDGRVADGDCGSWTRSDWYTQYEVDGMNT